MAGFLESPLYLLDSATLFPSLPLLYGTARWRNGIVEFETKRFCVNLLGGGVRALVPDGAVALYVSGFHQNAGSVDPMESLERRGKLCRAKLGHLTPEGVQDPRECFLLGEQVSIVMHCFAQQLPTADEDELIQLYSGGSGLDRSDILARKQSSGTLFPGVSYTLFVIRGALDRLRFDLFGELPVIAQ